MTSRDLDASVHSFFDLVSSCIGVRELWMGANQSLGRCRQGSIGAIAAFAWNRRIRLRRLEVCKECNVGGVLRLLGEGKLRSAIKRVGLAPMSYNRILWMRR
jgi:hypothetical protein